MPMMTTKRRIVTRALCAMALLCGVVAADESAVVRLYLDPPVVAVGPGESTIVAVRVENIPAAGLAAFQVELAFDPRSVELLDPNAAFPSLPRFAPLGGSPVCAVVRQQSRCPDPEWMFTRSGRQALGATESVPAQGKLTIAFGSAGDTPPVTGDGTLALIEVRGKAKMRSPLTIVEAILADADDPPNRYRWKPSENR
jgi:hypothetical protein